ncbi:MAG TPA: cupin domain-containing protein [Rhizomicrobium sp.]|nr:cupin domain-containing protein [Rhizomicrobium sp.]
MPKRIDPKDLPALLGTFYPPPYDKPCRGRERRRLGDAAGLSQYGVNLLHLPSGAWSSQRHWHTKQDEFIYVLEGEVVLVTDAGEEILKRGDCAGFRCGEEDGHHLQNRSGADALILEVGTRVEGDGASYPDIDLVAPAHNVPALYTSKDGVPYTDIKRRGPDEED